MEKLNSNFFNSELTSRLKNLIIAILIYRIGAHIPVPGLDPAKLHQFFEGQQNSIFGLFNMFSGGALSRVSIFAIGIMPYISASIIINLFSLVLPSLEQLKKEGETGRKKINQITRYFTVFLSCLQSIGIAKWLVSQQISLFSDVFFYFQTVLTLVTGTMLLMWIGEQITEKAIGNGISLIIFSGIVSNLPSAVANLLQNVREGQMQGINVLILAAFVFFITLMVVFVEMAQRRIRINYAQKTHGQKVYAAQSSHLPLKINISGVIPPIFASSIILLPSSILHLLEKSYNYNWLTMLTVNLSPGEPLYTFLYSIAIIFFAFFYTSLVFNPKETAENLKKSGAYIPGIRPGEQTMKFIDDVMTRLTFFGAIYLTLVCLVPQLIMHTWNVSFYFGGTSLLIIVVVVIEFITQVQSLLMNQKYDSLLKKTRKRLGN